MPYSDITLIRNVSGLTTAEKVDADITPLITIADNIIDEYTNKTWSESDGDYQQIKLVSALLVSWLASLSLAGGRERGEAFRSAGYDVLDKILVRGKIV